MYNKTATRVEKGLNKCIEFPRKRINAEARRVGGDEK